MENSKNHKVEVLVTDPITVEALAPLHDNGRFRLQVKIQPSGAELDSLLKDCVCWLVRSQTKITDEKMARAPRLRVIGRAGVGVDNIDVEAASRRGILVMNVPGGNTLAATEHTFAMLLSLSRMIPQAHADLKAGLWNKEKWLGTELAGKTLGIIGLGRIGRQVLRRAAAFEMKTVVFDPYVSEDHAQKLGATQVSLEDLLKQSDFITVHASLTDKTRHLLNSQTLKWVKPGARLVNCARGDLIDEAALLEALKDGRLKGAALDVFSREPLPADSPLLKLPNVIVTPHLGASTEEAQIKVAAELAQNISDYFTQGSLRNAVNLPGFETEVLEALGSYLELAERLGRFACQIVEGGLSEVEIRCSGSFPPNQRYPLAVAVLKGLLSTILDEPGISWVNAPMVARQRGIRVVETADQDPAAGAARLLTVKLTSDRGSHSISGTRLAGGELQIVQLDSLPVEVGLSGSMLVIENQDQPGVIGWVGTVLGKHSINIADMRVGRQAPHGKAVMVITVEERVPSAVLQELQSHSGVKTVHWVKL